MSVKATVGQLYMSKDVLGRIAAQKLPPVASFRIARAIREINKELEQFTKTRNDLIQEYGEELENGDWKVKDEFLVKYQEAINAVADEEIELPIKPLKPSSFDDVEIAPGDAMAILFLFEEE